jgi:hypothetical protein
VPATPLSDQTGFTVRSTLIVDISVCPPQGAPEAGEAGMEEAEAPHAAVRSVALEDTDPPDLFSVGLPVIEDHKAHAVSTSNQFFTEENLLSLCTPDVGHMFPP